MAAGASLARGADPPRELVWAGDPEGGAPFVEADPSHPDQVVGFDVEVADLMARGLGRTPRFVNITFTSIDQSIARGDADIGLSGIEDTPARRAALAPTIPYYEFREVLSVRDADAARFRTLADLRGRSVATLGGTIAYEILLARRARSRHHGRVVRRRRASRTATWCSDASTPCCSTTCSPSAASARCPDSRFSPTRVAIGHYVGVLAARNAPLRDAVNEILRGAMRDGSLERIFRKWNVWNDDQPALYRRLLAGEPVPADRRPRHRRPAPPRCRAGRRRAATCRRCCGRRWSRSCCRACRWRSRSPSAC